MRKRTPPLTKTVTTCVPVSKLTTLIANYIQDGQIQRCSDRTCENRRDRLTPLRVFAERKGYDMIGKDQIRDFLHHLSYGHLEPEGRFGNPKLKSPVTSGTVKSYYSTLRAFFNWLVDQEELSSSPMEKIAPPVDRPDQVVPFTQDEVARMLKAAKQTTHPIRDEAILLILLDCGLRASELCNLTAANVNLQNTEISVEGKGGKKRVVPFSPLTKRLLYRYLQDEPRDEQEPLFLSDRGTEAGSFLTRVGLGKLIRRISGKANVANSHPHRWRHTFAVSYLRAGGGEFALQMLMGHTSLTMTRRYVALAQADVSRLHSQYSPVTFLVGSEKGRRTTRNKYV